MLTPDEHARAARLRAAPDRAHWVASRVALRVLLGALLACGPDEVPLRGGRDVRPHLDGAAPWLSFNVTHAGELAMIAFASRIDVGVDLEQRRPMPVQEMLLVAQRVLPGPVVSRLTSEPTTSLPSAFFQEWVRHEALTKCRGDGLVDRDDGPLARRDPEVVVDVATGPHHAAALALSERPRCIELLERP